MQFQFFDQGGLAPKFFNYYIFYIIKDGWKETVEFKVLKTEIQYRLRQSSNYI